jgi:hypothetical protein
MVFSKDAVTAVVATEAIEEGVEGVVWVGRKI